MPFGPISRGKALSLGTVGGPVVQNTKAGGLHLIWKAK